jgi:TatD DNase family protein
MMLVDTHAHLDFPEYREDVEGVLGRAKQAGIERIITIGISLSSSRKAISLAEEYSQVYATVGIHPHGAELLDDTTREQLIRLARNDRVVALGEMGLDYFRDRQPRKIQQECLRQQLEIACELRIPGVFHIREAHAAFFEVVKDYASSLSGGVLHCFSGDWEIARRCLDMGFYLSIPGTVTFSKAHVQQEVVERAPLDRLLIETDAPYLAPVPFRGKVNEPALMVHTAQKIAQLRGTTLEEVAYQTTSNAWKVFGLTEPLDFGGGSR